MKKYILLIVSIFCIGIMNVEAANDLMQCDYNARYGDGSRYIKYRITYRDDGTIFQTMPQNEATEYTEGAKSPFTSQVNFSPTIFLYDSNTVESAFYNAIVASQFTAEAMKPYYEKKTCPYLAFSYNDNNYYFFPVEDSTLHDPFGGGGSYIWVTDPKTKLFNKTGEAEEPEEPKLNKTCPIHTKDGDIDNIPGFTMDFQMYDNGDKYFKIYFTTRGEESANLIKVKDGEDVVARLSNDYGKNYTIIIEADEIPKIFKQSSSQINKNEFTCPTSDGIYFIEESYTEAIYSITTSKEKAEEYDQSTDFKEGTGVTEIENNLNFTTSDCESYLGSITDSNDPAYYLDFAFKLIKYATIVLLLALTILDFVKATTSSKDDAIKKAMQTAVKRAIIAVIIFFAPILINFILDLLGVISTDPTCGIK